MKTIYILLTKSDTIVSKIIGLVTADRFTHASISFNETLCPLYSFSRKYIYRPLPAGLRHEPLDRGFFKHFEYIPCALYALEVEDEAYYNARHMVKHMMSRRKTYGFNIIGLFLCRLNIPLRRRRHYFCSQFVSEVLKRSNAVKLPKDTGLMRPADYTKMPELTLIFKGNMKQLVHSRKMLQAQNPLKIGI